MFDMASGSLTCQLQCRLPEEQAAQTLAGRDNSEGLACFSGRPYVSQEQANPGSAHFVAECFFLTQRVIHTGLMPAGTAAAKHFLLSGYC